MDAKLAVMCFLGITIVTFGIIDWTRGTDRKLEEVRRLMLVSREDAIALCRMWSVARGLHQTYCHTYIRLARQCHRQDGHLFYVMTELQVDDEFTRAQLEVRYFRAVEDLDMREAAYQKGERMNGVYDGRL